MGSGDKPVKERKERPVRQSFASAAAVPIMRSRNAPRRMKSVRSVARRVTLQKSAAPVADCTSPKLCKCFNCGEAGHAVADCTAPKLCKCCGSADHAREDCNKKDEDCAKCGKKGHIEAICRGGEKEGDTERPPREKRCFNCGETGHAVAECTKGKLCNCCGSPDHEIKDCDKKDSKCEKCGRKGHLEARCRKA